MHFIPPTRASSPIDNRLRIAMPSAVPKQSRQLVGDDINWNRHQILANAYYQQYTIRPRTPAKTAQVLQWQSRQASPKI